MKSCKSISEMASLVPNAAGAIMVELITRRLDSSDLATETDDTESRLGEVGATDSLIDVFCKSRYVDGRSGQACHLPWP